MKKISKGLYFGMIYGMFGLASLFTIVSIPLLGSRYSDDVVAGGFFIFLAMVLFIIGFVFVCILFYKLWDGIQVAKPRSTPGQAVGFGLMSLCDRTSLKGIPERSRSLYTKAFRLKRCFNVGVLSSKFPTRQMPIAISFKAVLATWPPRI